MTIPIIYECTYSFGPYEGDIVFHITTEYEHIDEIRLAAFDHCKSILKKMIEKEKRFLNKYRKIREAEGYTPADDPDMGYNLTVLKDKLASLDKTARDNFAFNGNISLGSYRTLTLRQLNLVKL